MIKNIANFTCEICEKTFFERFDLVEHCNVHSGETPFLCRNCLVSFGCLNSYVKHARLCPNKNCFPCISCTAIFYDEAALTEHSRECCSQDIVLQVSQNVSINECNDIYKNDTYDYSLEGNINVSEGYAETTIEAATEKECEITQNVILSDCNKIENISLVSRSNLSCEKKTKANGEGLSKSFKCSGCQKSFLNAKLLRIHERKFPSKHNFCCETCGKSFTSTLKLEKHLCLASTSKGPFQCSCFQMFETNDAFRSHIGNKPHSCCACKMLFNNVSNLVKHIRTHTQQKPFVCKDCGRGFTQAVNLRNHLSIHLGENAIKCDQCNFSCKTRVGLFKHKRKHLMGQICGDLRKVSCSTFSCSICSKEFRFSRNLAMHMRSHEKNEALCTECGKLFTNEKRLSMHKRVSHGTECVCAACGKLFSSSSLLNSHMKIHVTNKDYICEVCNKGFAVRSYLLQHIKTHSTVKPFSCQHCGKQFKVAPSLKYHLKVGCS